MHWRTQWNGVWQQLGSRIFAVLGPPHSEVCGHNLSKLNKLCGELGIPLAPEKEEGPITSLIIDTTRGELRLPEN